jgi:hypothetical protein
MAARVIDSARRAVHRQPGRPSHLVEAVSARSPDANPVRALHPVEPFTTSTKATVPSCKTPPSPRCTRTRSPARSAFHWNRITMPSSIRDRSACRDKPCTATTPLVGCGGRRRSWETARDSGCNIAPRQRRERIRLASWLLCFRWLARPSLGAPPRAGATQSNDSHGIPSADPASPCTLVLAMGGIVSARRNVDRGSTFTVLLPAAAVPTGSRR